MKFVDVKLTLIICRIFALRRFFFLVCDSGTDIMPEVAKSDDHWDEAPVGRPSSPSAETNAHDLPEIRN